MNKKTTFLCELLIDEILPQNGQWHFFGEENDEQYIESNIPFHATNKTWLKKYIEFVITEQLLKKYKIEKEDFKLYLQGKDFDKKIKQYQEKIVDFQIRYATRHDDRLYSIKDKSQYIEKLFKSVFNTLVGTLNMDRDVVSRLLADKHNDVSKMFDNSTKIHRDHIGQVHKCGLYCEDIFESLR